jgi:hypothetical protein
MIHFTGTYYKVDFSDDVITILDTSDNLLATMSYYAEYGVVANWAAPRPEAEDNTINVRDASMLSVDDEVKFINQQLNEVEYHTATISDITDNVITFTPALPVDFTLTATNPQLAHGVILKRIDNTISSITSPSVNTSAISGGTKVTLSGTTAVASLEINMYCLTSSHKMRIEVITTYSTTVNVFRERVMWSLENALTSVYTKNRKYVSSDFDDNYWVGNQGCVFGSGDTSILTYNNYQVCSVEVDSVNNELIINIDDDRDHRFRHCVEFGGSHLDGIFEEENASLYNDEESRANEFNLYIGLDVDFASLPRLMINPSGYLATFVWDSHADGATAAQMLAVFYGDENHIIGNDPTKGAVAHNFLISHGIFASWAYDEEIKPILDDLHDRGYEINLHSLPIPWDFTTEEINDRKGIAYPLMSNTYNVKSRSDHHYSNTLDNFCGDGLVAGKDAYMKGLWDTYGVCYHSSAMSEDANPDELDVLSGDFQSRRSPLYYKHPTRYGNYLVSAQAYKTAHATGFDGWAYNFASDRVNKLINNWGAYVGHTYFALNSLQDNMEDVGGVLTIKDDFDQLLQDIKSKMNNGSLNITTKGAIMEYWEKLENIGVELINDTAIDISNLNGETLSNFSIAMDDEYDKYIAQNVGVVTETKTVGNSTIISFDLPDGSIKLTKYNNLAGGQNSTDFINNIQTTLLQAAYGTSTSKPGHILLQRTIVERKATR